MKKLYLIALCVVAASGCSHRIEVAASEPINLNIHMTIEHNIRVQVEKELDDLFENEEDIF